MSKNDTGFDAFFRAVTSSPEMKSVASKDRGAEFQKGLKSMESEIKKASEMTKNFKDSFDTPEAREIGNSYSTSQKSNLTQKNSDDENTKTSLEIQYFEKKNPETWGFAGVAGMEELKNDLRENFIKPLKFKFLVEKLEKESLEKENLEKSGENKTETQELDTQKAEVYKQIHDAYKKFNVSIPTGILFYGPPGTGKTFITKKLAQELGAGLIKKSVGEFGSSYMHQTSQNIKNFFEDAKKESNKGPIILFLDEIDSLLSKRTNNIDQNKAEEVSQFLQEFNALDEAPNLIVIAATNRPDHLDSAIMRSGRLDKKIYIGAPDFTARKELFQIYIQKEKKPHKDIDFDKLAELTDGYVSADIEAICDEVARDASQNILNLANNIDELDLSTLKDKLSESIITMDLLEKAISETTSSIKYVDMSVFDEWLKK